MRHDRASARDGDQTTARHFIFCTGIENSYPVITGKKGQQVRRDGMASSDHYRRWKEDFSLVRELGITFLRYGPPYFKCHRGPMQYDWSFADETFTELRRLKIHPIADLCHFGVPDWIGDFQNPEWPHLFAAYCRAFAEQFPWVQFYTPVNEIFVCARFSAQLGWWNEQLKSDQGFVTALKHMARATILAEQQILEVQPNALFIHSESSEYFHAGCPKAMERAEFYNQKRFLSLDLIYGHDVAGSMHEYLLDNGVSREEYHWFLKEGSALRPHCIMGNDYYITNEHEVQDETGASAPSGEIFGYYVITQQYFDRYHLPVMHTETNRKNDEEAPSWLWKQWANVARLKRDGVPILGFTWYSLLDQTDWDTALREENHRINPLGLFDLNRKIRKVGEAYRKLIDDWRDHLPLQSMARDVGVTTQDIQPRPDPISPRVAKQAERDKRRPLRIQASSPSRDLAGRGHEPSDSKEKHSRRPRRPTQKSHKARK